MRQPGIKKKPDGIKKAAQKDILREMEELRRRAETAEKALQEERSRTASPEPAAGTGPGADGAAFRAIVEMMNEGALALDSGGTIAFSNRSFSRMMKMSAEEIAGSSFYPLVAREYMDDLLRLVDCCFEGENDSIDIVLKRSGGEQFPARVSAQLMRNEGRTGLCLLVTDLSEMEAMEEELKESERELRLNKHFIERIANTTPNILHVYDIKAREIVYSNHQIRNILGYTPGSGAGFTDIAVHPDDYDLMVDYLKKMAAMKSDQVGEIEYRAKHANGQWRWLRSRHVIFSRNADGAPRRLLATTEDITERKRTQEEKERFIDIIEATSDLVSFASLDRRIQYINRAGRRMLGLGEQEDISTLRVENVHPQWALDLVREEGIPAAVRDGMWTGETSLLSMAGKEIPVSQVIIAHRNRQGGVEFLSTVGRDISERKRAEAALRESEEFHRVTLGNISDAVFITTDTGLFTYIGPNVEKIFGYGPDEVQSMVSIQSLLGQSLFRTRDLDAMGELLNIEKQITAKNGEQRILLFSAKRVSIHGGTILYIGRDITERKRAEMEVRRNSELLEKMFANIHVKIAYMDASFNFIRVNQTYAEADERYPAYYVGKNHFDLFPGADNQAIFQKVVDTGEPYFVFSKPFVYEKNPERGVTYWDWGLQPVTEADGRVSGLILSLVDVTRRKRAEEELLLLNEELEEKVIERTSQLENTNTELREEIVQRVQAQRALFGSNMRLVLLSEISRLLLSSDAPQRIVTTICEKVMAFLDCQVFFNFLVDETQDRLKLNAFSGVSEETAASIEWLDYGNAVCGCVARDGCRIVAESIQDTPDERTELVKSFGITAYACHPLTAHGRVIGTLSFGTSLRNEFTDDELELMKTVTDQVAIAMDRVRMFEAEKQRAGELDATFASLSNPVIIYDIDGKPVKINPAAGEAYGMALPEFNALGDGARREFIRRHAIRHPDGRPAEIGELASTQALEGKVVTDRHFLFTDSGGTEKHILASAAPVYAGGIQIGAVMTWQDVSELELTQARLRSSERKMQELFRILPVGVSILDERRNVLQVNPAMEEILRLSKADLLQGHHAARAYIRPDGSPMPREEFASMRALEEKRDVRDVETGIVLENGEIVWTSVSAAPLPFPDWNVATATVDITRRKNSEQALYESEQMFRQLAENILEVFWIRDIATEKIIYVSPAFEQVWGLPCSALQENPGMFTDSAHPEDRERIDKAFSALRETHYFNEEFRIIKPEGAVRWIWARVFPVYDENGSIYRRAGIARDITDRKKYEEETLTAQKLESIGVLAGGIAHDFNNLLTAILGNVSLTKMSMDSAHKSYKRLENAEKACELAKDLSYRLLTFAKGGEPVKKMLAPQKLLADSVGFALSGSNVRAEFFFDEDLWQVEVDEDQMKQVIYNLVINADEAMPGGGILSISAKNTMIGRQDTLLLREGPYLLISIKDQGTGIPAEHLPRIFDPYYTTRENENRKGRGLGLSICHSIVRKHEGQITVESAPGEGTAFHIYLPSASASQPAETGAGKPARRRRRILFMDDEALVRDIAGEIMNFLEYDAVYTERGEDALEEYMKARRDNRPFDAVILDLTVPGGMGGAETMRKLHEIDAQIKGIVVSGYADNHILRNYSDYGFADAIAKPFRIEHLKAVLEKILA